MIDSRPCRVMPGTVFAVIVCPLVVLLAVSLGQDLMLYSPQGNRLESKIWMLDVDVERSFYTWYSSILLFIAGQLCVLVGFARWHQPGAMRWHWLVIGLVFLMLSGDEALSIHEKLGEYVADTLQTTGIFFFAWTIPAMALVALGLLAYVPFLRTLRPGDRWLMLLAAAVFLSGAIGTEMLSGAHVEQYGVETLQYRLLVSLEEALEGLGACLFILSVLRAGRGTTVAFMEEARAEGPVEKSPAANGRVGNVAVTGEPIAPDAGQGQVKRASAALLP